MGARTEPEDGAEGGSRPARARARRGTEAERSTDRWEAYEQHVSPEHSATPREVAERTREGETVGREVARDRPAAASGEGVIGDESARKPAERAGRPPGASEETGEDPPAELAGRDGSGGDPTDETDGEDEP